MRKQEAERLFASSKDCRPITSTWTRLRIYVMFLRVVLADHSAPLLCAMYRPLHPGSATLLCLRKRLVLTTSAPTC